MTISYNWLCDYFPDNLLQKPSPEQVSRILTSVGLEVETLQPYSSVRGGLEGLVVGEVISVEPHPNADKLKITQVNIGSGENPANRLWCRQCRRRSESGGCPGGDHSLSGIR